MIILVLATKVTATFAKSPFGDWKPNLRRQVSQSLLRFQSPEQL